MHRAFNEFANEITLRESRLAVRANVRGHKYIIICQIKSQLVSIDDVGKQPIAILQCAQ